MDKINLSDTFKTLFIKDRKCIVNADIDGVISGMLLQHFLNWKVVGYSSCCGLKDDDLWIEKGNDIDDCVFVDLPVILRKYAVIDQHFVATSENTITSYNSHNNKVNPNIMRKRVLTNQDDYKRKYPFGTAHFVLAILENLGIINANYLIDFNKRIGKFDLADLILRADRVIGNTKYYTSNCMDWAQWMIRLGGVNTEILFNLVQKEYLDRVNTEKEVENKLKELGCKGQDGDCSNLFRDKNYSQLTQYFIFLSNAMEIPSLPIFDFVSFQKLCGKRVNIDDLDKIGRKNIFSFAMVKKDLLSLTYIIE